MPATARFPDAVIDRIRQAQVIGIRGGRGRHRVIGIWAVTVGRRVFVRSWGAKPDGWNAALATAREGTMVVGTREMRVRARRTRAERTLAAVDAAYRAKYHTPASLQWVREMERPRSRATTMELGPAGPRPAARASLPA